MASFPIVFAILAMSAPAIASEPGTNVDLFGDPLPLGAIARLGTLRFRTADWITHLSLSPDGTRLLSQSPTAVAIWEAQSGRKLVEYVDKRVGPAAWRADGSGIMLVREATGSIHFGDFESLRKMPALEGADSPAYEQKFNEFAISPDGKHVIAVRAGKPDPVRAITVWELESGKLLSQLRPIYVMRRPEGTIQRIIFSPDGKCFGLFTGATPLFTGPTVPATLQFTLYELPTGKERAQRSVALPRRNGANMAAALSADGRFLAIGGADGACHLYDLGAGGPERTFAESAPAKNSFSDWSAIVIGGEHIFAFDAANESLHIHDIATGREIRPPVHVRDCIEAMTVAPDGKRLATAGRGDVIRLWDVATGRELGPPAGHIGMVWQVQILADGARALTWGADSTARLWELTTGKELLRFQAAGDALHTCVTPDQTTLLTIVDNKLRAYDLATASALRAPAELAKWAGRIRIREGNRRTMIVDDDKSVSLWDWPEGRLRRTFPTEANADTSQPREFCLSPDGKTLVAKTPGRADVWDAERGVHRGQLNITYFADHSGSAFLQNGRFLAIMGNEGRLGDLNPTWRRPSLWDLQGNRHVRTFAASGSRRSRAIGGDPRGYLIATSEEDKEGSTLLYEIATGQIRRRLAGHFHSNTFAAFTPDGQRLVTVGADSTGLVWDLSLVAAARGKQPVSEADLERAWTLLDQPNTEAAWDALIAFASNPEQALKIVRQRLQPAPRLHAETFERIITDLESDHFATRQKATKELEKLGRSAAALLKESVEKKSSLELKRRLTSFLERFASGEHFPEELRAIRSLEFLEDMATPLARAVIADLSKGEPSAELTLRAIAANGRLERRHSLVK